MKKDKPMSPPTPGPWRVIKRSNQLGPRRIFVDTGKGGAWYKNGDHLPTEVDEANARLIAQAPAMYQALNAVIQCNDYCYIDGPSEGALPSVTYEFSQVLKRIEALLIQINKGN